MMTTAQTPALTIPGPPAQLGGYLNLIKMVRDPIGEMGRLFSTFGPLVNMAHGAKVRFLSSYPRTEGVVFVRGPELLRQIATKSDIYHRYHLLGPLAPGNHATRRQEPLRYFAAGLFDMNEGEHRRARRLMLPAFHRKRVENYRDRMIALTQQLAAGWAPGATVDLHHAMTELTMQIVTSCLFGVDPHSSGEQIGRTIQHAMDVGFNPATLMVRYDWPGTSYSRFLDIVGQIEDAMRRIIYEKRLGNSAGDDVLSMLMQARDEEDGSMLSEHDLLGHAELLFIAGHETSSNALSFTLLLLSQHPDICADLVDELTGVLGADPPTVEQLRELPLLDRVIKESMRVLPPVPWNSRIAVAEDELAGQKILPATEILMSIYHTHHLAEIYPDPERFDPTRWEQHDYGIFEYNPFSGGPRMCIGASFATMEIKLVLATLLQRFRFELVEGATVNRFVGPTMSLRPGLPMRVMPQDRQFQRGAGNLRGNLREMVHFPASTSGRRH
ncbi:MAG: cytochrome P450 [Oscillochloris sp.]|nr:cytochrome P450 [Oscillochloris sp.]